MNPGILAMAAHPGWAMAHFPDRLTRWPFRKGRRPWWGHSAQVRLSGETPARGQLLQSQ